MSNELRLPFCGLIAFLLVACTKGADVCNNDTVATNQITLNIGELGKVIRSPGEGIPQHYRATCGWQVTGPAHSVIYIRVFQFKWSVYTSGDDCDKENFKVFDGSDTSAPLIVNYCKNKLPPKSVISLYSTGPSLRVQLKTSENPVNTSFIFIVEALKADVCKNNDIRNLPEASRTLANFSSPYFSQLKNYPRNSHCSWKLTAPAGNLIKLTFKEVKVRCDSGVNVYDDAIGSDENMVVSLCRYNSLEQRTFYSTGQTLFVTFKSSDSFDTDEGFLAFYQAISPGVSCSSSNSEDSNKNIILASKSGTITSPGFPSSIPNSPLECIWKVSAPAGQVIRFDMDSVDIDYLKTCPTKLQVVTGGYGNLYDLEELRCQKVPSFVTSSDGRNAWVRYEQDADVTKEPRPAGFSVSYTSLPLTKSGSCGNDSTIELQGEGASFRSPNYPERSPSNMRCRWKIIAPDGMIIQLRFRSSWKSKCNNEWFKIYDGDSTSSPELKKVCYIGRLKLYSTSNKMLVEQLTREDTKVHGFVATFTAVRAAPKSYACPSIPKPGEMKGKIASPEWPLPYPNLSHCRISIEVPFGHQVKLTFTAFSLEDSQGCKKDSVRVEGRDKNFYWTTLGFLCGNRTTPFSLKSTDNEMIVWFSSDLTGRSAGFEAEYEAVRDTSFGNCTEQGKDNIIPVTSTEAGSISSPRFPLPFPTNMRCTWVIRAPPGKHLRLAFSDFELGFCKDNSVVIRDGDSNGRLLGEFCSRDQPPVFFSTSRDLWVNFQSSPGSNPFRGFKAHYEVVSKLPLTASCNDAQRVTKIKGETGTLASYEYPLHYQNNVECVWILTSGSSKVIKLTFDTFDLESSASCTADYVEVRDGNFVGDVIGRYCGQGGPGTVTSSESSMYIKFHSNGNVTATGFMATYTSAWSTRTIVLIAVFSCAGVIGLIAVLVACLKYKPCSSTDSDETGADVPLNDKE